MSKGGSVDTSNPYMDQASQFYQTSSRLAQQNWNQGQQMYGQYEEPTLNALLQLAGLGPGGASQYQDPLMNRLMQPGLQAGQQAAGAATRDLMNMDISPVSKMMGKEQINLGRMANVQTGALTQVQQAIQQLLTAGQQGTNLMAGAPGQITQAGQGMGQLGMWLQQLQVKAQQSQNTGMLAGLKGIGSLIGMLGGSLLGGPFGGALGGMLGGAAGGAAGSSFSPGTGGLGGGPNYNFEGF